MKPFFLSIVIPSYNEMANLQKGILDKVKNYLSKHRYNFEVIIVDDGSDDGSHDFVKEFAKDNKHFQLIENNHLGKAGAVTTGVLAAKGDYILFTDMDQATPIESLEDFLPYIENDYDIVIGSRTVRQGSPWSRKVMSQGIIILRSIIVGIPEIKDTQCGFKLFRKEAAKDIFSQIKRIHDGFRQINGSSVTAGFDVELLYIANKKGYRVKEVPVKWLYVETRRVSPLKDSVEGVAELIKIRMNILKGIYS